MANEHKIDINKRDDISRQSLKQLRRAGNIPGIYYSANSKESIPFYIQKNENNKNIFVEFYKKNGDEFEFIDWTRVFDQEFGCGINFDSRFPRLNIGSSSQSLNGKLRY